MKSRKDAKQAIMGAMQRPASQGADSGTATPTAPVGTTPPAPRRPPRRSITTPAPKTVAPPNPIPFTGEPPIRPGGWQCGTALLSDEAGRTHR